MRFLPALALVFSLAACDSAPGSVSTADLKTEGEVIVLATFDDLTKSGNVDIYYNAWEPGGYGEHSVAFLDGDGQDIVEFLYTDAGTHMQVWARWPGMISSDVSLLIQNDEEKTFNSAIVSEYPKEYTPISTSSFGGTSIHRKPDGTHLDNGFWEEGQGWCTVGDTATEVIQTVPCDMVGLEFTQELPNIEGVQVRTTDPEVQFETVHVSKQ